MADSPFQIEINGVTLDVTPPFNPDINFRYDSNEKIYAEEHNWNLKGYLTGTDADALMAAYTNLIETVKTPPFTIKFKDNNTTTFIEIDSTDTDGNSPRCLSFNVPEVTSWASNIPIELHLFAIKKRHATAGVVKLTYRDRYSYDRLNNNLLTQTRRGEVWTDSSTSARTQAETLRFAATAGFRVTADEVETSNEDNHATFTFERTNRFSGAETPGNTTDAARTKEISERAGICTTTWTATFTGGGAKAQAEGFKPTGAGDIVSKKLTENIDENSWTATWVAEESCISTLVNVQERLDLQVGIQPIKFHPIQGLSPIRVRERQQPSRVTQTVTASAYVGELDQLLNLPRGFNHPFGLDSGDVSATTTTSVYVTKYDQFGAPLVWTRSFVRTYLTTRDVVDRVSSFLPEVA